MFGGSSATRRPFSVVDIVQVLTQQPDSTTERKYWNKLEQRLIMKAASWLQTVTN
jgi:hypothetical protein